MKKTSVAFLAILLFTIKSYSQDNGIQFVNNLSWSQVKEKAKMENKYIFVDVYATWCGPCKMMDAQVYPTEAIGKLLNDKFISIKVQQDQTKDDNAQIKSWYEDARFINQEYKVEAMPTFLFFSPEGKLLHRGIGYQDSSAFRKMAQLAFTDPIGIYQQQLVKFKNGERNKLFLYNLAILTRDQKDEINYNKVINAYLAQIKEPYSRSDLQFLQEGSRKINDDAFLFIIKYYDAISKIQVDGQKTIAVAQDLIRGETRPIVFNKEMKPDLKLTEKCIVDKYGSAGQGVIWQDIALSYYFSNEMEKWYSLKVKIHKKYPNLTSAFDLNNDAWHIFQFGSTKKQLETVLIWSQSAIEKEPTTNYYDTFANILYKLGRKVDAIKTLEKALSLNPGNGSIDNAIENLKKMKKGEPTWGESANDEVKP